LGETRGSLRFLVNDEANNQWFLLSREDKRSVVKTNPLEMGAFTVMSIAVRAGRNDDKTDVSVRVFHRGSVVRRLCPQRVKRRAYPCWSLAAY